MAQQTVVEWFAGMITEMIHEAYHSELADLFEQAKEMEKQQHSETWHDSRENTCIPFEDYYNQTYKSE
jgi:hypothetical protein